MNSGLLLRFWNEDETLIWLIVLYIPHLGDILMRRFEIDIEYTLQLPFINLLLYLLFETHVKSTSRSKMVFAHSQFIAISPK